MSECGHNCASCSGCGRELVLGPAEIDILKLLGQVAFLPIARRIDDAAPIYLEDDALSVEEYSLLLQTMEVKRLITLDFDRPLKGSPRRGDYPIWGSMALTQRGQQILEWLDYQGITE